MPTHSATDAKATATPAADPTLTQLVDRLLTGRRAVLAKAITAVESGSALGQAILDGARSRAAERLDKCLVVGLTGPPGCGKSTLTNSLVAELRNRDRSVGVVAVDPSSPISGGALLGDRLRMSQHANDSAVFVRSLSSRGRLGGLAPAARDVVDLMAASGMDTVVVETVGAGQTEVEIASLAKVKVVVGAPGLGDDIQAIKSGILEIADIFVVNKSDLPGADRTASQLRAMQTLRPASHPKVPVLTTCATDGNGIAALVDAIAAEGERRETARPRPLALGAIRQALLAETLRRLEIKLEVMSEDLDTIYCERIQKGEIGLAAAAREIASGLRFDPITATSDSAGDAAPGPQNERE